MRGSPEVSFKIPGLGSFRATGPQESRSFITDRTGTGDCRGTSDSPHRSGTQDLELLQRQHELATTCDNEIAKVNTRLEAILADQTFEAAGSASVPNWPPGDRRVELKLQPEWQRLRSPTSNCCCNKRRDVQQFIADVEAAEKRRDQAAAAANRSAEEADRSTSRR